MESRVKNICEHGFHTKHSPLDAIIKIVFTVIIAHLYEITIIYLFIFVLAYNVYHTKTLMSYLITEFSSIFI